MQNIAFVQILYCFNALVKILECLWFWKGLFIWKITGQWVVLCIFHDHADFLFLVECTPQLDDVRMIQLWVNCNLSLHKLQLVFVIEFGELDLNGIRSTILTAYILLVPLWRASRIVPKFPIPSNPWLRIRRSNSNSLIDLKYPSPSLYKSIMFNNVNWMS